MTPPLLDPAVEAYIEQHTTAAPAAMQALDAATRDELGLGEMLSGPVVGRLLETLVFLTQPKLVVEIGTFSGSSALWMAGGLGPDGHVLSCEVEPDHAFFARRAIEAAGLSKRVEVVLAPGLETIEHLEEPVDLAFIDADKVSYLDYYEALVPRLSPRGLIVADNTLRGGAVALSPERDEGTRAIVAFNARVAADPRVVATVLPVRDGVTLIRLA